MRELANKQVMVIDLGRPVPAACEPLSRSGARVTGVDQAIARDLVNGADRFRPLGIEITLGGSAPPERDSSLAPVVEMKGVQAVGPLLSKTGTGKHAFLVGGANRKLRAAWNVFAPCTMADSLLKAIAEAARNAALGDVALLSPACSSWGQSRNDEDYGEASCPTVKSIGRGVLGRTPKIHGTLAVTQQ